ncbi:hypothetical protein BASA81_002153 [Batrachochytrium salamandrivorans]|nr:hypothetical protein BASA81_002153 [Batrachochytrium salamandrivorans]
MSLPSVDRSLEELLLACEQLDAKTKLVPLGLGLMEQNLVDFSVLDRLLIPLEQYRPTQLSTALAAQGAAPKLSPPEDIVARVVKQQLDSLNKQNDQVVDDQLDHIWQSIRNDFLDPPATAAASAPSTVSIPAANPTVILEETAKMSRMFSLTFKSPSQLALAPVEEFKKTSVNADCAELWSMSDLLLSGSSGASRPQTSRTFLQRQYRQVKEGTFGFAVGGGDLKQALGRQIKDPFAVAFLLCRCGEFAQASEVLMAVDSELARWIRLAGEFQPLEPFVGNGDGSNLFRLALENLGNFTFELDPKLAPSVEDFLWFRLCAITTSSSEALAQHRLQLLVKHLVECGPEYFSTSGKVNPFLFARYLFCVGEVERALEYLVACSGKGEVDCKPEAVHLAISLRRVLLPSFNLVNVLVDYSQRFITSPVKAMSYLTLAARGEEDFPLEYAKRLVVNNVWKSRELFAVVHHPRLVGDLAVLAAQEVSPQLAVTVLTGALEQCGNSAPDSVKHHLHSELVKLVLREVCRVLPVTSSPSQEREFWRREASKLVSPQLQQAISLLEFYDLAHKQDEDAGVSKLMWLVPSTPDGTGNLVGYATRLLQLDGVLLDAFPDLCKQLLVLIDLAYRRGKQEQAKMRLRLLVALVARLREQNYHLRRDVERELVLLESRLCL